MEESTSTLLLISSVLSGTSAIAAIVAPILVAFMNQRGAYKLKSAELFYTSKAAAYNEYIRFTASFPTTPSNHDLQELNRYSSSVLLYASKPAQDAISRYGNLLVQGTQAITVADQVGAARACCIQALQQDLQKYAR